MANDLDSDDVTTLNLTDGADDGDGDGAGSTTTEDRGDSLASDVAASTLKTMLKEAPVELLDDDTTGDKAAGARIPKARLDEVIGQRDQLRGQLEEAQRLLAERTTTTTAPATTAQPSTATLKDLRAQSREALMDGDLEKAAALDEQIDAEVISIAQRNFENAQQTTVMKQTLNQTTDELLAKYPFLDEPAGAEALDLIVMARDKRIATGMSPAQALREATELVAPRFGDAVNHDKGLQDGNTRTDTRAANANARGAMDSNNQPAVLNGGAGNRTTAARVNVDTMTEAQFEALPDAEKRRLRGD